MKMNIEKYRELYPVDDICELGRQKVPVNQIARVVDVHKSTIRRILDLVGIPRKRNKPKVPSGSLKPEILDLYEKGNGLKEIARTLGCSHGYASTTLAEFGIQPRSKGYGMQRKKRVEKYDARAIKRMYTEGKSLRTIAKVIGINRSTVTLILKDMGVKIRTLSEANRLAMNKTNMVTVEREAGQPAIKVNKRKSISKLRADGLTIDQIAEVKGINRVDVYQELLP